jgi:hypothetical protein
MYACAAVHESNKSCISEGEQLKWLDKTKDTNFLINNENNDDYGLWIMAIMICNIIRVFTMRTTSLPKIKV